MSHSGHVATCSPRSGAELLPEPSNESGAILCLVCGTALLQSTTALHWAFLGALQTSSALQHFHEFCQTPGPGGQSLDLLQTPLLLGTLVKAGMLCVTQLFASASQSSGCTASKTQGAFLSVRFLRGGRESPSMGQPA